MIERYIADAQLMKRALGRPHHMHSLHDTRPVARDLRGVARSVVYVSVCLCVVLVKLMGCAIEMPFRGVTQRLYGI